MEQNHYKYCILILSFCLAVSLGGNLYSLAYPLAHNRSENETIAWIPAEYTSKGEVFYPEVIPMKPDSSTEDSVQLNEDFKNLSDVTDSEEVTVSAISEKPVATQQPSIRYNGATVYVTKSGTKFHRENCSSLSKSKIAISFEEACEKMYEPCGKCKP